MSDGQQWTQIEAIWLCRDLESICPTFGCHVALTGGLLYKDGQRKDCDVVFYRIRQEPVIKEDELWEALEKIGLTVKSHYGFCVKCDYRGKPIDIFFPEASEGGYGAQQEEAEVEVVV